MNRLDALVVVAMGVVLSGNPVSAQDLSSYRAYVLESSLETVVTTSGARLADARTLHERPAKIQELEWRTPYTRSGSESADPVREVAFTFYNNALYRVIVRYDRDRTEGLTDRDLIASLSTTYGTPVPASQPSKTARTAEVPSGTTVIARWDSPSASMTLLRSAYSPELQLILISKTLTARAGTAIKEAAKLDAIEAPQRESEQKKKDAADATAAQDKSRTANKAAFRP